MTTVIVTLSSAAAKPAARWGHPRRVFTWELAGVLTLMGSSAACAVFALVHLS